jgi:hypothetical protein
MKLLVQDSSEFVEQMESRAVMIFAQYCHKDNLNW